jgi:prepilin-type N-terminal cleavage/methylation domain-containing protein
MKRAAWLMVDGSWLRKTASPHQPSTINHPPPSHPPPSTSHLPPSTLSRRAGLTLIEVLLALAILGATAGVLMTAVSRCLAVVRQAKSYYDARRVLDLGELDHPLLVTKDPLNKQDKVINLNVGPIDYDAYAFTRTGERSPTLKDLVVVKTRVAWSSRGRESVEEVTSYLYYTNELPDL